MAQTLMVENNFSLSFLSLMFNRLLGLIIGKDTESKTYWKEVLQVSI